MAQGKVDMVLEKTLHSGKSKQSKYTCRDILKREGAVPLCYSDMPALGDCAQLGVLLRHSKPVDSLNKNYQRAQRLAQVHWFGTEESRVGCWRVWLSYVDSQVSKATNSPIDIELLSCCG